MGDVNHEEKQPLCSKVDVTFQSYPRSQYTKYKCQGSLWSNFSFWSYSPATINRGICQSSPAPLRTHTPTNKKVENIHIEIFWHYNVRHRRECSNAQCVLDLLGSVLVFTTVEHQTRPHICSVGSYRCPGTAQEDGQQFAWPCLLLKAENRDKWWPDRHELICPKFFPGEI